MQKVWAGILQLEIIRTTSGFQGVSRQILQAQTTTQALNRCIYRQDQIQQELLTLIITEMLLRSNRLNTVALYNQIKDITSLLKTSSWIQTVVRIRAFRPRGRKKPEEGTQLTKACWKEIVCSDYHEVAQQNARLKRLLITRYQIFTVISIKSMRRSWRSEISWSGSTRPTVGSIRHCRRLHWNFISLCRRLVKALSAKSR